MEAQTEMVMIQLKFSTVNAVNRGKDSATEDCTVLSLLTHYYCTMFLSLSLPLHALKYIDRK